ncbi:MAG: Tad domain-containing protein [Chloroflexi bacterium]|nr:Tad domain-containing protein [Chloroflexota bacterium]MBV9547732.1 Tad domain-containing protein [Chloroflexota bacterium]
MKAQRAERAQVIVWVAVMIPMLFLPVIGLAISAGAVFDARRDLQNVADGAARAGGMQIDETRLQALDPTDPKQDGLVRLDTRLARTAARGYLTQAGIPADQVDDDVTFNGDRQIIVTPWRDVQPTFLKLFHASIRIRATGVAEPCSGVATGACP